jgi:hypothetical protein
MTHHTKNLSMLIKYISSYGRELTLFGYNRKKEKSLFIAIMIIGQLADLDQEKVMNLTLKDIDQVSQYLNRVIAEDSSVALPELSKQVKEILKLNIERYYKEN